MRILITGESFPPNAGGSGWSTYALAKGLRSRGHTVQVVQPRPGLSGTRMRTYEGIPVIEFGYRAQNIPGARSFLRRLDLERGFAEFLSKRTGDFDIIHAQHVLTIPPAVTAGQRSGVPVISTVRDYWPVCVYGTLWRENEICTVCKPYELRRCLRQRYGLVAQLAQPIVPLAQRELEARQRALAESDGVVAVSHYVADKLQGLVDPDKLAVIPNIVEVGGGGGDDDDDSPRRSMINTPRVDINDIRPPFILFAGKLNILKGADLIPYVMEKSRVDIPLVVVGEGSLSGRLAQIPNVKMLGWIANKDVLELMARATMLLFPSRWAEPLARTLLEAQAVGAPTVALDTGGTRDVIQHEYNGLLAENENEFAAQIARLAADEALQQRLRENAKQVAANRFSPEQVLPQFEQLYMTALERRAVTA